LVKHKLFIYLFIYLLQLGFQPMVVGNKIVLKQERDSTKEKQYKKQYKNIDYTKQKTKLQNRKQT